ncbi:MAG: ParB-like chromosome segregation protein Spo0J [Myxococcota bacterium]|jgi:ParB-like chromosome segregation protein Spo0J
MVFRSARAYLRDRGVLIPISVSQLNGRWQIIDGFRRVVAARAVGLESIAAVTVDVQTPLEKLTAAWIQNRASGTYDDRQRARTLARLCALAPLKAVVESREPQFDSMMEELSLVSRLIANAVQPGCTIEVTVEPAHRKDSAAFDRALKVANVVDKSEALIDPPRSNVVSLNIQRRN